MSAPPRCRGYTERRKEEEEGSREKGTYLPPRLAPGAGARGPGPGIGRGVLGGSGTGLYIHGKLFFLGWWPGVEGMEGGRENELNRTLLRRTVKALGRSERKKRMLETFLTFIIIPVELLYCILLSKLTHHMHDCAAEDLYYLTLFIIQSHSTVQYAVQYSSEPNHSETNTYIHFITCMCFISDIYI